MKNVWYKKYHLWWWSRYKLIPKKWLRFLNELGWFCRERKSLRVSLYGGWRKATAPQELKLLVVIYFSLYFVYFVTIYVCTICCDIWYTCIFILRFHIIHSYSIQSTNFLQYIYARSILNYAFSSFWKL